MMERRKNLNDKFGFVEIMEVSLNEIGEIITGNTPSKSDTNFWNSPDICFIKPDVIAEDEITELLDSNEYISENARNKARIVNENSILVTCIGSIAKIGIVKIRECAFNQQINAIIPNKNIDTKYLCYCLQNSKVKLKAIANAPVVPIINKKQFGEFVVKIDGDISTQKKIVNRLDYIQSVITLYKIQLQKFDDLIKARFIEMFGSIYNSKTFVYYPLKEITTVCSGGTPNRDNKAYWEFGTIPWVKTTELKNNRLTHVEEFITELGLEESSAKLVPSDTVLVAMYGQGKTRGMTGYLEIEATTNQACACILPTNKMNMIYLWKYFELSYDKLRELAKGGNQPNLNCTMIKDFNILVPPIELQNQFANFVQQVDKSRFDIKKSITELEREVVYD